MPWFRLNPDGVPADTSIARSVRAPSLPFSIIYGGVSLGLVSVLAYSVWAYRLISGAGPMYAAIAAIYIGLGGFALSRLLIPPRGAARFAAVFAIAFLIYALLWCAFWFGCKGKYHADLWGSVVGLAAMLLVLRGAFHSSREFLPIFAVLFTFHTLGYYAGDVLHTLGDRTTGRLLWGAAHGVGFGAGIGYVLFQCQLRGPTASQR
jgi:hypothetical protein